MGADVIVDGIVKDMKRKGLSGLYLLCGEEALLRDEAVSELVDGILDPGLREFNLAMLDAESCQVDEIVNSMLALPVFSSKRVSVVRSFDSLKAAEQAQVFKAASRMPGTNVVFLLAGPMSDSARKAAAKAGRVVEFKPLYEGEAVKWAVSRMEGRGLKLSYQVAHYIVSSCGCDLRLLAAELDKLATYIGVGPTDESKSGKGGSRRLQMVTMDQVSAVIGKSAEVTVFDLIEAIGMRDAKRAIGELKILMDRREDPVKIIGSIAWQIRTILQCKLLRARNLSPQSIVGEMKKPLFAVRKYLAQAQNFTQDELESAIHLTLQSDLDIKAGRIPAQVALERLVIGLCHNVDGLRQTVGK